MTLFARHSGRHARHGSLTGWAGLASIVRAASAHPVVDDRITRPVLGLHPSDTHAAPAIRTELSGGASGD